ncbi:MAG: class I SAM-dependent methyltransferase [Pikeienuella sp.]
MAGDDQTLNFYDGEAAKYAPWSAPETPYPWLEKFLSLTPPNGQLLDFGCGGGWAAARMVEVGRRVDAIDGSAELVAEARKLFGIKAKVGRFETLDAVHLYDGIWAHFSLLHSAKADMPAHLDRIFTALKPSGQLYIGLKAGEGEKRDSLGRFYAYYEEAELKDHLTNAGFSNIDMRSRTGEAYDGGTENLWHAFACRPD